MLTEIKSAVLSLNPQHCFFFSFHYLKLIVAIFISLFIRLSKYVQWFHGVTAAVINNRFRVAVFQL